jgi:(1->4)-alpha-D-glucan 1-alpha-D-glucosylmutase
MWNSLAQVLVKIASPGVPDFYQGNEIWAFDLVDPDNRRAVNYEVRRQMLAGLRAQAERNRAELMDRLRENLCDGAIKMFITSEALRFRRDHPELFSQGDPIPAWWRKAAGRVTWWPSRAPRKIKWCWL